MRVFGIEFAVSLSDKNFVLPGGAERPAFISWRLPLFDLNARYPRFRGAGANKCDCNRKTNYQRFWRFQVEAATYTIDSLIELLALSSSHLSSPHCGRDTST